MKPTTILKAGTVKISEEGILITDFAFGCGDLDITDFTTTRAQKDALVWARDRIRDSLEALLDVEKGQ